MTKTIRLNLPMPDDWVEQLEGTHLAGQPYDTLLSGEDVDVLKPDGSLLLALRPEAILHPFCKRALPALRTAVKPSRSRGAAAGGSGFPPKLDGSVSNYSQSNPVPSGIIGYDKHRGRVCRETAWNAKHVNEWYTVLPFLGETSDVFRRTLPDRYEAQMAAVRMTPPQFVIQGTAFTTVTVNRSWPTAVHKDSGDLPEGFGVMSVLRAGAYEGGHLVFPKFRIAVDLHTQDVLLADVHEFHGNTAIIGVKFEPHFNRDVLPD